MTRGALFVGGAVVTSTVASLSTAVYALYHFQQIASYSVLANALAMPVSGLIIMPMMMVSYVLMPFGAADASLRLMGTGVEWLLMIARWTESLPGSVITTPAIPQSVMIGVSVAGIILILGQARQKLAAIIPAAVALVLLMFATLPDVLASGDGDVLAVYDGSQIYVSSLRKDKFAVTTWAKRWNVAEDQVRVFPKEGHISLVTGGDISCDGAGCRVDAGGINISFGTRFYELQQDCSWANVIISPSYLPRNFCGDRPVKVFGHYDFQKNGALAIGFGQTFRIKAVKDGVGHRPWQNF